MRQFVLWALACARFQVDESGGDCFTLRAPEDRPSLFNGASSVRFTFGEHAGPTTEHVTLDSRMFQWVLKQLGESDNQRHSVPNDYPQSIHEIGPKLFEAYKVDSGSVQLAGCALEDRPLLRVTVRSTEASSGESRLRHRFFTPDGGRVSNELAETLGADELVPAIQFRRSLADADVQQWISVARTANPPGTESAESSGAADEFLAATVVWLKYADGKLRFTIGEQNVELPFAGWARLLARGLQEPPPYVCPLSGLRSHHLQATDDGRITVAEAIAACEVSGRRVLAVELKTCEVTGKRVLADLLHTCPVTERRMLETAMAECGMCKQRVSESAIKHDRCVACRGLTPIRKEQARLARVLGEYPKLDRWRSWKLAETATVYILEADSLWRRLLLIVNKETLDIQHVATASRFGKTWLPLDPAEYPDQIGQRSLSGVV
ncbi:MAG: hypothetical protein KDA59_09920 [Planctomycetales bacterium]|nr:hypothetical protein [Planctomycetales bacterium]